MHPPRLDRAALEALGRAARQPRALLGRSIGSRLREQVILRVSSVNSCPPCSLMHGLLGRLAGLSRDEILAARAGAAGEERAAVALRFAELRTTGEEEQDAEAARRFDRVFSPLEQQELCAVVDLFTFMNRLNNTWEAVLPGARWRRRWLGLRV